MIKISTINDKQIITFHFDQQGHEPIRCMDICINLRKFVKQEQLPCTIETFDDETHQDSFNQTEGNIFVLFQNPQIEKQIIGKIFEWKQNVNAFIKQSFEIGIYSANTISDPDTQQPLKRILIKVHDNKSVNPNQPQLSFKIPAATAKAMLDLLEVKSDTGSIPLFYIKHQLNQFNPTNLTIPNDKQTTGPDNPQNTSEPQILQAIEELKQLVNQGLNQNKKLLLWN